VYIAVVYLLPPRLTALIVALLSIVPMATKINLQMQRPTVEWIIGMSGAPTKVWNY